MFFRSLKIAATVVAAMLITVASQPAFSDPANPAHAWVNGKWTTGEGRWQLDLELEVSDGFIYHHQPSGQFLRRFW